MSRKHRSIVALALAALLARAPAQACGPYIPEALFWFSDRPNEPIDRFLDGNLGIVDQQLAARYRFVAYRYITGLGLDAASRAALAPLFTPAPLLDAQDPRAQDATERWLNARRAVAGEPADGYIDVDSQIVHKQGDESLYFYYRNCLDDAFDNAAATLRKRAGDLGATSPVVVAWVKAQDEVFVTCGGRGEPPAALGESDGAAARADRAYQIAAATFYLARFDEAEKLFRAIAADTDSPWREVGSLMVARTLLRRGVLSLPIDGEALRRADAQLAAIESDPQLAAVHASATRLRGYVAVQLDPNAARQRLATALTQPTLAPDAAQQLIDYLRLASSLGPQLRDGLAFWLRGYPCEGCTGVTALLEEVAAATDGARAADMPGPDAGAARQTLAYFRARHLAWAAAPDRDPEKARLALDRLLAGDDGDLSFGDRNRVLVARAPLATSLEEYLRLSQLVPVGVLVDEIAVLDPAKQEVLLTDDALLSMDAFFSAEMLERALETRALLTPLARRVALFAWMKTNLVGDETVAARLVPFLRDLAPEMLADLDAWNDAKGDAKRFAFALGSLRFAGMQPSPGTAFGRGTPIAEIDPLGDNWWCAGAGASGVYPEDEKSIDTPMPPTFLSTEDLAAAAHLREQIAAVESAPQHLGSIVFEWARTHADDPRVPEALHRVVKTTRYTHCEKGDNGATSRRAFNLLHKRYPDSPWTKQTPFWFGGS